MSTKYGIAFLCMPKCASTSIEKAIQPFCNINFSGHPKLKHINAQLFSETIFSAHKKLLPNVEIESFSLIRDPLERMESRYRYKTRDEIKNPNHPNHRNYTGGMSYNEYIKEYISEGKRKPFANLASQYDFLTMTNGEIGVDHIMPMNRLDLVADFLSKKIGREIEIPHENISPKFSTSLDHELEKQLRQYLAEEIVMYEFIKGHGKFNKALHSDKLLAALKACR